MTLVYCGKCKIKMFPVLEKNLNIIDKCPNCDMTPKEFNKLNRNIMSS